MHYSFLNDINLLMAIYAKITNKRKMSETLRFSTIQGNSAYVTINCTLKEAKSRRIVFGYRQCRPTDVKRQFHYLHIISIR